MYLSETSLASCCCPGGKKSASSNSMKDTLGKPRVASKLCDGKASIFTPFSSITVSLVLKLTRPYFYCLQIAFSSSQLKQ
jgi:hypothetical protein